jgi:antitoxin component YwqK of YwqJK toxin-antitoxin module
MPIRKKTVEAEVFEKNGRHYSRRTEFYDNGQIRMTGVFTCSQNDWSWSVAAGTVSHYYENGKLKCSKSYNDYGALDGETCHYDKKGNLAKRANYKNDKLVEEEILIENFFEET